MMKPTRDKKLKESLKAIHLKYCGGSDDELIQQILIELDNRGYHIGLPESIEWALNSGDGTYHP